MISECATVEFFYAVTERAEALGFDLHAEDGLFSVRKRPKGPSKRKSRRLAHTLDLEQMDMWLHGYARGRKDGGK